MSVSPKISDALDEMEQKDLGKIKVMMVEDDTMISEIVSMKLISHGCVPYSTRDGDEAINYAEQYEPDAIILDLMLPGLSGEEILGQLKQHPKLKETPVIIFSNKSSKEDKEKTLSMGADEYFIKAATDLNVLVDTIKRLANKKPA